MFRYSWRRAAAISVSIGAMFTAQRVMQHYETKTPAAFAAAPAPVDEARLDGLFAVVRAVSPRDRDRLLKTMGSGEPLNASAQHALVLGPDYLAAVRNRHWQQQQQQTESSAADAPRQHPDHSAKTQQWMGATAALRLAGWTDAAIAKQRAAGASVVLHVVQRPPRGASDHASWDFALNTALPEALLSRNTGGAAIAHLASTAWAADPVLNVQFVDWVRRREHRSAIAACSVAAADIDETHRATIDEFHAALDAPPSSSPTDGTVPPTAPSERVVSSARRVLSRVLGLDAGFVGDGWVHTADGAKISANGDEATPSSAAPAPAPALRVRQYLVPSVAAPSANRALSAVIELQWP
jgi:hypothetical protein